MQHKNYIWHAIAIVLASIVVLFAMGWLPDMEVGGVKLRRVDLLSQLREGEITDDIKMIKPAFVDSCRAGVECIDDFSDDDRGMVPLYRALSEREQLNRPVRIAVLGDSYIEGDILTSNLREMLQKKFGGCGVGFVQMASDSPEFRRTVIHSFKGWSTHCAVESKTYKASESILNGFYFTPQTAYSYVELRGQKTYCTMLDTCQVATVYFKSPVQNAIRVTVNDSDNKDFAVSASDKIQQISVNGKIGKVRFTVANASEGVSFYGATMDPKSGVIVDNFSLRGSSGAHIKDFDASMLSQFDQLRHYDLVIIMFGLNVANTAQTNYEPYRHKMNAAIAHMKKTMPETGFLVIGVGDREQRQDGEMKTMKGIKELMAEQQRIASDSGIAFWNLYEAMGGSGSIVKMVNGKPRKANLDYTHINFLGGRDLAELLYDAIDSGFDNYQRRIAYENE